MVFSRSLGYWWKQNTNAENLKIEVKTFIVQHGHNHSCDRLEKSFYFLPDVFMEEDESPEKEELFYFLTDAGIDENDAHTMIIDMILLVCDVIYSVSQDHKGILTLFVNCLVESGHEEDEEEDDDGSQIEQAMQQPFSEVQVQFRAASKLAINSLSRKKFKKRSFTEKKCTICLETFVNGAKMASLPCGHQFHNGCAVKWLETSHICPLCRFQLPCESE